MGGRHLSKPFLSVYGHVSIDQILTMVRFPEKNTTEDAVDKTTLLGGTGSNISTVAASLGVPTAICAFVGEDFPAEFKEYMESKGLMTDELVVAEGYDTSTAVVVNDTNLDQMVFFYQGPQGYASSLGKELIDKAKQSDYVHFCTGEPEYYIDIMGKLKGGPKMGFDPAQEIHRIWTPDKFNEALGLCDLLFCNKYEAVTAERYLGHKLPAEGKVTINTLGDKGAVAWYGGKKYEIPIVKGGKPVDATGAGDAFRGGFYAGLYNGYDVPDSLIIAAATSSFIVEKIGALSNVPTWDMVVSRADKLLGRN